ncbi:hypothetical protein CKAN_00730200 [Cinnamomum micranthum f. kanehirae]|uniref:Uncharacterized protein n=1 Tax=Cinnamomum micranthum f. kanehirae TaxID=337451 RepID=A0A3S4NLD1_9MAGN|nr:hypothetical protein CKAN_00730200 [Cinnamomum micranthum f. kanehirae]
MIVCGSAQEPSASARIRAIFSMARDLRAYGHPIPAFPLSLLNASLILPQRLARPSSLRPVIERLVGKARPRNKKRRGLLPLLPLKNDDLGDGENCQDRNGWIMECIPRFISFKHEDVLLLDKIQQFS